MQGREVIRSSCSASSSSAANSRQFVTGVREDRRVLFAIFQERPLIRVKKKGGGTALTTPWRRPRW